MSEQGHPQACAGLPGGCPDCRDLYLSGLRSMSGGREAKVGVCAVCGHTHWPWEAHAASHE